MDSTPGRIKKRMEICCGKSQAAGWETVDAGNKGWLLWFMYGLCMVYVVSGYFVEHSWGKKGTKDVKGKFIPSCFSGRRFTLNLKNRNCNDYEIWQRVAIMKLLRDGTLSPADLYPQCLVRQIFVCRLNNFNKKTYSPISKGKQICYDPWAGLPININ